MSTTYARPVSRPATPVWVGALAAVLAVLTGIVAAGWEPLAVADTWTVAAAHAAVSAHAGVVTVLVVITDLGGPVTVTLLTAVLCVVLLLRGRSRDATYVVLVRVIALGAETALKHLLARPRPDPTEWLTTASGFSFPSGHTTGTTALCASLVVVVLPHLHRHDRAAAVAVAAVASTAVAASRVLLGVHYPSDVVGGLLLGTLVAVLLAAVMLPNIRESVHRPAR